MRHNVYGKHLGRDKNQRTALFRGLIRSLVLEGSIVTTEAKVKAIKGLVDKLFTKAKKGDQASQNVITKTIPQKEVAKKIMELSKTMKTRNSGFCETVRLGERQGDGAMLMKMSIISEKSVKPEKSEDEEVKVEEPEKKEKAVKAKAVKKVNKK
ncbi:MAG: bL17 family ribosomal protein [Candidatus Daviesbacteria bacterium]|nr:bL17 family ribosomal protein [Candidatus Daviesbacteria bacterium]